MNDKFIVFGNTVEAILAVAILKDEDVLMLLIQYW